MASEFPRAKLSQIATLNPKRPIERGAPAPFIDMAAISAWTRDVPEASIQERPAKGSGSHFRNGDTLLARITPCLENGKTAQVRSLREGVIGEGSTEFIVLAGREAEDNDYVYYVTRSPDFREFAIARMVGSSGRQRVSWQAIEDFELNLPPKEVRREAASLLSSFDDRIEVLRQTNTTLEAISQALFKSWFVDFDPVRAKAEGREPEGMDAETAALFPCEFEDSELGLIPKGWRWQALADAFEINPKRVLSKGALAPYLDMASVRTSGHVADIPIPRVLSSGSKFQNGDTLLARITPCLENGKTAYVDFLDTGQVGWGSTEFIVLRPKGAMPPFAGYLLARQDDFRTFAVQAMSGSSGRQRVELTQLSRFPVVVPPDAIAAAFGDLVEPLRVSITENERRATTLADLRDTLLPRLISGKLRLPEAQAIAEEMLE